MIKRNEAVDVWVRLTQHPSPAAALRLIAAAHEHAVLDDLDGERMDAFIEHLDAALDSDSDAPKSQAKFDKWAFAGDGMRYLIDDPWELVHAWNERGNPERPCMRVRILRQNEQTGKKKHAGYFEPTQELTIEFISARFGGGTYRVELLDAEGQYCTSTKLCIPDSFQ